MSIGSSLPKLFLVIVSVWLLVTGMALLNVVDVSDEFGHPWVTWEQAMDPELGESDDELGATTLVVTLSVESNGPVPLTSSLWPRLLRPFDTRKVALCSTVREVPDLIFPFPDQL